MLLTKLPQLDEWNEKRRRHAALYRSLLADMPSLRCRPPIGGDHVYYHFVVTVPAGQNSVQVSLAKDYFQLEAIVVTGQATGVERKNLANAVATVTAEQLVQTPATSVEHALSGKVTGANITTTSGAPGGGNVVQLRGVTSIIGKFTPLYVVDGVIVSDVSIAPGTNLLSRSFGNGLGIAGIQDNPVKAGYDR